MERFVFDVIAIYHQVGTFAVILGSNQLAKDLSVNWILIVYRMEYFNFMSTLCQAICNGKYVFIIRTCGLQTKH